MAQKFLEATAAPLQQRVTGAEGVVTPEWESWFHRLGIDLQRMPYLLNVVALDDQSASISATSFENSKVLKGLHWIGYHAMITQVATTSSSLTVTFTWTENGQAQTQAGAAMTGNALTTKQSGVILLRPDAGTAINYATTYASVGAQSMEYSLDIALEYIRPRGNW